MNGHRLLWGAIGSALMLAAPPSLRAQSFSVNSITASKPSFGVVAAAASGNTVFRITPAGTVSVVSGNGGDTSAGTESAATITIRCSGGGACNGATALVKIWPTTTVSGRASTATNLTVASGTGTVGTVTTNSDGSIEFPLTGFTGTGNKTLTMGLDLTIAGDDASTSTSAAARWRVGVAKSPTVPTGYSQQTNAIATVRKAISLTKNSDLAFGAIRAPDSGNSVVTINATSGARTLTSGGAVLLGGITTGRAQYSISGQASTSISISVPASLTLVRAGGGSLTSTLTATASGTQTLSAAGTFSLGVGGALTVPSGTAGGNYSGTFTVTVGYN